MISNRGCVCAEINTRHCPVHGQGSFIGDADISAVNASKPTTSRLLVLKDILVGYVLIAAIASPVALIVLGFIAFGPWFALVPIGAAITAGAWWCGQDFRKFEEKEAERGL